MMMAETIKPAIEVKNLSHSFKTIKALDRMTFAVMPKSIHGFVGPNGAGKTTALKILATLLKPQSGKALVYGRDVVRDYKSVRTHLGFMPDHFSVYRQMTVFEYLDFFAAAYGMGLRKRDTVIKNVLTLTDMESWQDELIKRLSRGMQQRVSLARVLVHDPDLLLLDEPAAGLDPRARIELMEILRELARIGKTVFISSHILSELAMLCDSVTIIDRGVVKYSGSMKNLLTEQGEICSYVLSLSCENEACEEALRKTEGVREVKKDEGEPRYTVIFNRSETSTGAILQAVLANGGEVVSFQEDIKHLNEAFMDLTEPGVRR
jgi:ABC-2 type transport system ATP-binding protein